jgi:hypothetical protein
MQIRKTVALCLLAVASACTRDTAPLARVRTARGATDVALEVADTPETRSRGLMYRNELPDGRGMLFVFDDDDDHEFWMKNTLIPLDMIFADSDGRIIGIVENAAPLSESIDAVDGDSQYVLEVNGGFCKRHGVIAGDRLRFIGFVPNASD